MPMLAIEHPDPKPDIKPLQKDCHKVKIMLFRNPTTPGL